MLFRSVPSMFLMDIAVKEAIIVDCMGSLDSSMGWLNLVVLKFDK